VAETIHLGYEIGTGKSVEIPLRHMVVTGQTQEAGKTTTLEALIARAKVSAIAFVTKRGEQSFGGARRVPPYFRERADWQFVASVLEATMRERMKFERAWIMRASKGAKTLAGVHANVKKAMEKAKGMSADVYLTLDEYLSIVVPRVATIQFASSLELEPGLNVIDVSHRDRFPPELQSLVMRSALEWVYEHCQDTVTIIPEAWEFCPQGRGSPVKLSAIELMRKGAGLRNYVWIDSQDIGGVDKELLRQCPVWLLGVQREANEIKRVLDAIPAGVSKPRAADIALLEKGQFFACFGRSVIKTYVVPAWAGHDAIKVAMGTMRAEDLPGRPAARKPETSGEDMDTELHNKIDRLAGVLERFVEKGMAAQSAVDAAVASSPVAPAAPLPMDTEALYQTIKTRLAREAPQILELLAVRSRIEVKEIVETIQIDTKTLRGRVALMIVDGFFDQRTAGNAAFNELKRVGFPTAKPNVYRECDNLTAMGFLTKEDGGYQVVDGMVKNIKRA